MKNLLRRYRRFEGHSLREVVLQTLLPDDWNCQVTLSEVEHEVFDLAETDLYVPSQNQPHQQGAIQGFWIEDGVLWPGAGGVRTQDGELITDSFLDEDNRRFAIKKGYVRRFPTLKETEAAATLGSVYRNYYHRWADSISRIYALYHPDLAAQAPIRLYVDDRFTDDERRVIRHLLPAYAELERVESAVRVHASTCIHLPYLSSDRTDYNKWFDASAGFLPKRCLDWLRDEIYTLMDVEPTKPFRKLYVTRRHAKVRRLLNEEEVASYLRDRGFEVVALEKRPLQEQVQLFAEAKVIVAQHGAGLTNLLFAQSPRVLEIMSDRDRQIFFRFISKSHGFTHEQIHMDGENKNDDVYLSINELEKGLESLQRQK